VSHRAIRSIHRVYDRAYPIRNAKGEICRLAGVVEDITDRRKPRGEQRVITSWGL